MKNNPLINILNNSFPFQIKEGDELCLLNTVPKETWEKYGFKYNPNNFTWKCNITHNKYIVYNTRGDDLLIMNWDDYRSYKGKNLTIIDFKNALSLCKLI
jgi:hypothetical protein